MPRHPGRPRNPRRPRRVSSPDDPGRPRGPRRPHNTDDNSPHAARRHVAGNHTRPFGHPGLARLGRLRNRSWVRLGLVGVAVGFCAYGLAVQRTQVTVALRHLHWFSVIAALVSGLAGVGFMMLAWRSLLADLGSPLRLGPAGRVMFVGQLGKYVPGMVWAFAAQLELARDYKVPRRRSATATVVAMAVTVVTGLIMAAIALPLTSRNAAEHYWWVLACAPLILTALYPPLLGAVLDRLLRMIRQPPLERRISLAGLARCVGLSALGWVCYALQLWLLVADITGRGAGVSLLSAGAYALAWSVGFILIIFPSGVGPRELALIAALSPVMPRGSALVVAIVSRLVMTAADLCWAGLGLAIGRRSGPLGRRRDRSVPGDPTAGSMPPTISPNGCREPRHCPGNTLEK